MSDPLVYLGLGGNEKNVSLCLKQALSLLSKEPAFTQFKTSHFYHTAPFEMTSSDWFVNAVCSFYTSLPLEDVFVITQAIETKLGKIPKPKDASRPIDIDLLFYGNQIVKEKSLEIPHPRWKDRLFVLIPLSDLTSEILIEQNKKTENFILQDLIHSLKIQSPSSVSLLEKNPLF